jgi:FAD-dependent oxidoreductase domain-containing protein 1
VRHNSYDVVIIGGGIIGCSTAYHLVNTDSTQKIAVVEKDPTYTHASTSLSLANVRIQFSLRENIQISRHAFAALENFEDEMSVGNENPSISFKREGNLFVFDREGESAAKQALALQKDLGCRVELWPPDKISRCFPLYRPGFDTVGGTFGPEDGHFDAFTVLMGYRNKAKSLGAVFLNDEVVNIRQARRHIEGVLLKSGRMLHSACVVNCAGAWAADIALTAGVKIPVVPIKRQVFAMEPKVQPPGPLPLTILPSGLYFRTETGGLILVGKSLEEDPTGFDFSWDEKRFRDVLWPELAGFVPSFDAIRLKRGWAGLYAVNTLDGNAILGEWPELKGMYLANGFSGHGLQQAPAVGRYLAELIIGRPPTLDLALFDPIRILNNTPLSEGRLV